MKDHRDLAKELELYFYSEEAGQGLPILLPTFVFINEQIKEVIRKERKKLSFQEIITPIIGEKKLYETSGHLLHYEQYMFPPFKRDQETFYLRPMTCPHHCLFFSKKLRSYKELPFRVAEDSLLFRYESSGSLKGLERARSLELADHHVFVNLENLKKELKDNFFFVQRILEKTELCLNRIVCSFRDENKEKYHDNPENWNTAEKTLLEVLEEIKKEKTISFTIQKGEAAFYGPKIDFEVLNQQEKYITIATIQLDFYLPEKFRLSYWDQKQNKKTPILIHQSPIGSYQRFISLLVEQKQGKLPIWMIPCQLVILPISDQQETQTLCSKLFRELSLEKIRIEIWNQKTLSFRIKEIYEKKIPYYVVVGEKEEKSKEIIINSVFLNEKKKINLENIKEIFNYVFFK